MKPRHKEGGEVSVRCRKRSVRNTETGTGLS